MKKTPKKRPPPKRKFEDQQIEDYSPPTTRSAAQHHASYRIVNWPELTRQLEKCARCGEGPLRLSNTTEEIRAGLMYNLKISCSACGSLNTVRTDEVHEGEGRGPKKSKINERCVLGTIHSGNGHAQLEHLLCTMDIECMSAKTFKATERRVGPQIEKCAKESCSASLKSELESERNESADISISYDMGWQKRGKARNSKTGQGTAIGIKTGKVIDYATMNSSCRKCESAERASKEIPAHDCRKNHHGSAKSMEAAAAVEIYKRAIGKGVRYSTFVGDEDSTAIAHVKQAAAYEVTKHSDFTHIKRSFGSDLYKAKAQIKTGRDESRHLSDAVIGYLEKCFSYALYQNENNIDGLKAALKAMVPHSFGEHGLCSRTWCGYLKDPSNYRHKELPKGENLRGVSLRGCLDDIMKKYTTEDMLKKMAPLSSSQKNETVNSVVGSKAPKIRYYGGSESNDYRVAAGVAQVNKGCGYVDEVLSEMGIESGQACKGYIKRLTSKQEKDKVRKSGKKFKHQRRQLRLARRKKGKKVEQREGLTYASSISTTLSLIEEEVTKIVNQINLDDVREAERIIALPHQDESSSTETTTTIKNKPSNEAVFYYDLETTSRSKDCEIVQLSVVKNNNTFLRNIIPTSNIAQSATAIHGISVAFNADGEKSLMRNGVFLQCTNKVDAFAEFIAFLRTTSRNGPCVLIGHNAKVFDTPRLLHQLEVCGLLGEATSQPIYFSDSLTFLRKETWLSKSKALGAIYQDVTGRSFNAHDALEDAIALQEIMEDERLKTCLESTIANAVEINELLDEYKQKQAVSERVSTFKNNLDSVLSTYMLEKMARAGLNFHAVCRVYQEKGSKGVISLLAGCQKIRVTNKVDILAKIIFFLKSR